MKRLIYFPMALAALMLGACSSNEDVVDGGGSATTQGDGYISINLNLPTTSSSSSRAEEGTDPGVKFDDGLENEYKVNDATLIIFCGSDESSATADKAYALDISNWESKTDDPNQVTTFGTVTQKIEVPSADNIYAFVVLNNNGRIDVTNQKVIGTATEGTDIRGLKVSDLQSFVIAKGNEGKTNFLMSNVPVSNLQGGNVSTAPSGTFAVKVLADIDKTKIGKTPDELKGDDKIAADIYVERAMAKVTVSGTTSGKVSNASSINWTVTNWALDVTNKQSYFSRNITSDNLKTWLPLITGQAAGKEKGYRFAGFETVYTQDANKYYRTYWGVDKNYDNIYKGTVKVQDEFDYLGADGDVDNSVGTENPLYCFENTFNVDNQNQNQTTRVIAKVTLNEENKDAATFYAADGSTTKYDKDGVIGYIKGFISGSAVTTWYNENKKDGVTAKFEPATDVNIEIGTDKYGYVTVTTYTLTDAGKAKVKDGTTITDALKTDLTDAMGKIGCYENGVSYYPVRIKHFGDELTPWDNSEGVNITSSGYPTTGYTSPATRDGNYLGRYGVLRNNWYDIQVTSVIGFGYPKVPTIDPTDPDNPYDPEDTPDDEKASYIMAKINVLSWAKRTQSATLQ